MYEQFWWFYVKRRDGLSGSLKFLSDLSDRSARRAYWAREVKKSFKPFMIWHGKIVGAASIKSFCAQIADQEYIILQGTDCRTVLSVHLVEDVLCLFQRGGT